MSLPVALLVVAGGIALVVVFAGKLVTGVAGTATGFGVSAFVLSVVFLGFDPENLAVGAVGGYEGLPGIALGSILGAALVAIALAFGVTALLVPMELGGERRPAVLALPVAAVALFTVLCLDGWLSRLDGALLVAAYAAALVAVFLLGRTGKTLEAAESRKIEKGERLGRWRALGLLLFALAAILAGSEMIVAGSKPLLAWLGLSDTAWGMTFLALSVSIEEVARELPAALQGRPEITFGNVVGSVFAFFLLNAGVIALVRPLPVSDEVLGFHLPVAVLAVLVTTALGAWGRIPRWAGGLLVILYGVFFAGSHLL